MKHVMLSSLCIAALSMTFLGSCKKEEISPQKGINTFEYKVKSNIDYSKINVKTSTNRSSLVGGVLHFPDLETYFAVEADLERQVEELDDAFVEAYHYMNDDEISDWQDSIGFDEFQPLYDFEENFPTFKSIRSKIAEETLVFDEIEDQDPNADPEDSFIIFSDVTRTLINETGDIAIGNKIYRVNDDGSHWEINSLDVALLETLPDHTTVQGEQYTTGIKILIRSSPANTDCKKNKSNKDWEENASGDKKHHWKIGVFNYPFYGGSRMKIINKREKKKRRKTVWRRYRTETTLKMCGDGCDNDNIGSIIKGAECSLTGTIIWPAGFPKYKRKRSVDRKLQEFNWTKTNFITGTFIGAGGQNSKDLTF